MLLDCAKELTWPIIFVNAQKKRDLILFPHTILIVQWIVIKVALQLYLGQITMNLLSRTILTENRCSFTCFYVYLLDLNFHLNLNLGMEAT